MSSGKGERPILEQTVVAYREQVRLVSVQLRTGLVSPIVVSQAQAQLQTTLAQQRDVLRARAVLEHALAILCGRPAPSFTVAVNPLGEVSPPAVPPGKSESATLEPMIATCAER